MGKDRAALLVKDNFKGQITKKVNNLLETHNIQVCLFPPNTTDILQPMDIAVMKPIQGENMQSVQLDPITLRLTVVKEKSGQWFVEMAEYISNHPNFLVNGFIRSGITAALDETEEPVAMNSEPQESSYCSSDEDCSTCNNNSDKDD